MTISEADYNPDDISETHIDFEVITGEVWSKVTNLVDKDSEFLTRSGSVVAGVRGTTFNFAVREGNVFVEAVDHAAFVNLINKRTGKVLKRQTVVEGKKASIKKQQRERFGKDFKPGQEPYKVQFDMSIEDIKPDRFEQMWFSDNQRLDVIAAEEIAGRNLDRLRDRVGALPGDPGYEEKKRRIEERLAEESDPYLLAEMEARAAQMQANEILLGLFEDGFDFNPDEMLGYFDDAKDFIYGSGLDEELQFEILDRLQDEVMIFGRAFEYVLPDEEDLYEAKSYLREYAVELEYDDAERKEFEEFLFERQMYELQDFMDLPEFNPDVYEDLFVEYEQDFINLRDSFTDAKEFFPVFEEFLYDIEVYDFDPGILDTQREFLDEYYVYEEPYTYEEVYYPEDELYYEEIPWEEIDPLIYEEYYDAFLDEYIIPEEFYDSYLEEYIPPDDLIYPDEFIPPEEFINPDGTVIYPDDIYIPPDELIYPDDYTMTEEYVEPMEPITEPIREPIY